MLLCMKGNREKNNQKKKKRNKAIILHWGKKNSYRTRENNTGLLQMFSGADEMALFFLMTSSPCTSRRQPPLVNCDN